MRREGCRHWQFDWIISRLWVDQAMGGPLGQGHLQLWFCQFSKEKKNVLFNPGPHHIKFWWSLEIVSERHTCRMTIGRVHREWRERAKDLGFGIHIKITILLPSIHPGFGILYLSLCGHIYCHHHHLHNHNYLITKRMLWTQPQWTNGDGVRLIWKDVSPDHWCHLLSLHQYQCCHFKKYPNLWWRGQNSLIRRSTQLSCFLRAHLTLLSAIVFWHWNCLRHGYHVVFFQKQCCHFTFCISISSMTELSSHATQVTNCAIPKVSLLLLCGKFDRDSSLKGWTSHFLIFNFQIQAHLSLLSSEVHLLLPLLLLLLLLIEIPLPLGRWRWSSHAQAPEGPRPVLKKIRMTILLLLMLMTFKLWGWVHIKASWGVQMSPI